MTQQADVIVIGAGSTGAAAAWRLAERGAGRVLVLERRGPASGTTARSCCILRMHYTLEDLAKMAVSSRTVFENFDDLVGGNAGFCPIGWMGLARFDDVDSLAANVAMQQDAGIDARLLTPEEVEALAPGIRTDDVGAGAWEPESGYADALLTVRGFMSAAERQGATFVGGVEVRGLAQDGSSWRVETDQGSFAAAHVVVAAGCTTGKLVRPLGVDLPIEPVRHTVAVVDAGWPEGSPLPVVSDRVVGNYFRPTTGGYTLIGSTGPHDGYTDSSFDVDRWPRTDDIETLGERLASRFPDRSVSVSSGYTSIYDCTPDLQPLLGSIGEGLDGLSIAVGFSGHGFKLSPAIGDLLADHVMGESVSGVDIETFRASRFAEGAEIVAPHKYNVPTLG
jgi:sarcosine oxidase subunit beta